MTYIPGFSEDWNLLDDLLYNIDELESRVAEKSKNYFGLKVGALQAEKKIGSFIERIESSIKKALKSEKEPLAPQYRKRAQEKIIEKSEKVMDKADRVLRSVHAYVHSFERALTSQERYMKLGLPEEILNIAPDCVELLMRSEEASVMKGLAVEGDCGIEVREGKVWLKVEGKMIEWSEFSAHYAWDDEQKNIVCRSDPKKAIAYVSYKGFIHANRYLDLFPIHKLSCQELQKVQAHAATFDPSRICDGVVQFFTARDALRVPQPLREAFTQEVVASDAPTLSHYGMRVITSDGQVYSVGLILGKSELKNIGLLNIGNTCKGSFRVVDADEFSFFSKRYVTSVPASNKEIEEVLNHFKAKEHPFCFVGPNCATATVHVLKILGIDVNISVDVSQLLHQAYKIAVVGVNASLATFIQPCKRSYIKMPCRFVRKIFRSVFEAVSKVAITVLSLFQAIKQYAPCSVRKVWKHIWRIISVPFSLLGALMKTALVWKFGATRMTPLAKEAAKTNPAYKSHFSIRSWKDLFTPKMVDSSIPLLHWQLELLKQNKGTQEHFYKGQPTLILLT